MGESMSTAPTGGSQYRCTRGNCKAVLPGAHAQDAHNQASHLNLGAKGTAPFLRLDPHATVDARANEAGLTSFTPSKGESPQDHWGRIMNMGVISPGAAYSPQTPEARGASSGVDRGAGGEAVGHEEVYSK